MLILVDNYTHERKIPTFIFAFILFAIGVAYRQKGMFPAISYAAAYSVVWWLLNYRERLAKKNIYKEIVLALTLALIAIVPYGMDKVSDKINASTPELAYAREYQAERVKVTDYPLLGYYEDNVEKYEQAGLNFNDIYIVDRFIFDTDGAASLEKLKKINEINYTYLLANRSVVKAVRKFARGTIDDLRARSFNGMHIIILVVLSICIMFM